MNKEEVLKLSKLARINISEEEASGLSGEFDSILKYVSDVKGVISTDHSQQVINKNIMREDVQSHESRTYTEDILSLAPVREGNYIKVKKIL